MRLFVILFVLLFSVSPVLAHSDHGDTVEIGLGEAYAFASAGPNSAVFMTIENYGGGDDVLLSASTEVAETVEIHETAMEGGTMTMRKLDNLPIPENETVTLDPKSYHIMLLGLKQPLVAGEKFDLTLTFEQSGEMTFPVIIGAAGQKPELDPHDHTDHGDHSDHSGHSH